MSVCHHMTRKYNLLIDVYVWRSRGYRIRCDRGLGYGVVNRLGSRMTFRHGCIGIVGKAEARLRSG